MSAPQPPREQLNVKLVWLTVFRTVTTSLLLIIIAAPLLAQPIPRDLSRQESLSFGVIAIVYALTLIYSIILRRGSVTRRAGYMQVLGDVVLATALIYLTGGVESPFTFTFSLAVISAAIVLDQRGALVAAVASTVAFSTLAALSRLQILSPPGALGVISPARLVFLWVTNTLGQFLIAVLASYPSRQLSATGGALRAREADLRRLALLQEQILEAMPSGLVTSDARGQVTFVNRAGRSILGLPRDGSLQARPVEEIFPGIRTLDARSRRNELVVDTPDGERTLGLTVASLQTPDRASGTAANSPERAGELKEESDGFLIVFQDLTELRRVERELRRVDQLAALGTLSAQLAHEIRNPLASMRGAAQLLPQDEGASGRISAILVREADRLSNLVENFLRFARPPEPALETLDLATLVTETLEMVRLDASSEGVELTSRLAPVMAPVDPSQLKQVLLNLLRNAFLAARPSGRVEVETLVLAERARIRVWDSAGAIKEEHLARVFEPFFTTRQGGTGLGLSTAHSIVRAHQGQIHVTSSPARGTEFIVELPLPSAPQEDRRASAGR